LAKPQNLRIFVTSFEKKTGILKETTEKMTLSNYIPLLNQAVEELADCRSLERMFRTEQVGTSLPSAQALKRVVELARAILFPGYYGNPTVNSTTLHYHIGVDVEQLFEALRPQILAGLHFGQEQHDSALLPTPENAAQLTARFISRLPELRRTLATDVEAAYNGDPAATCFGEIISCYPAIRAISNYRIAHELLLLGVPLIPRILTEMAHSETGIDIHPGAQIGPYFTIDHGTGVVIGATSIIGSHVKLYQGVTLGAKSFPLDAEGNPIKGIPRHPILEDDVVVYSNATILGRITVGKGATVGGNIWVTEDVPAGARIVQQRRKEAAKSNKTL
jgi:serine O-acetyltransferase